MRELTVGEFYAALEEDPNLERLGPYRVMAKPGEQIFPIDDRALNLTGQELRLGSGDFSNVFVAFDLNQATSLHLGASVFSDLYFDQTTIETLEFADSKSSRVFFDFAQVGQCHFNEFTSAEVYFDDAKIETVHIENLDTKIIYPARLEVTTIERGEVGKDAYRLAFDEGGRSEFGDFEIQNQDLDHGFVNDEQVVELTEQEFLQEVKSDPDLRRLGAYRLVDCEQLIISLDEPQAELHFGHGDFSNCSVLFAGAKAAKVNFGNSAMAYMSLGDLEASELDFAKSSIGEIMFASAKLGDCFCAELNTYQLHGGEAQIEYFFGERGGSAQANLEQMIVDQFHANHLGAEKLHFGESEMSELWMSNSDAINELWFERTKIELMNMHECKVQKIDFENAEISKALINKCSAELIVIHDLQAEVLYFGNHGKNEIGHAEFGEMQGIKELNIDRLLRDHPEQQAEQRFKNLGFGKLS